jgi:subtilisin family serine protease
VRLVVGLVVSAWLIGAADHGAKVINVSWTSIGVGTSGVPTGPLGSDDAWSKGAVVVAAAGNYSLPFCGEPANAPPVICVEALGREGLPASYTDTALLSPQQVVVEAPGGDANVDGPLYPSDQGCNLDADIWSTALPTDKYVCGDNEIAGYGTDEGTSFAAPFVAGVAALLASEGLTPQQIVDRIRDTASNHGRFDSVTGYGLVNAAAAVG